MDNDPELITDVVVLLDLIDGIDYEASKWHHLLVLGAMTEQIRQRIGAVDRISDDRRHTNDDGVLDAAFERTRLIEKLRGESG